MACSTERKFSKTFVYFQTLLTLCRLFQLKCNVFLKSLDINQNENTNHLYFLFKLGIHFLLFILIYRVYYLYAFTKLDTSYFIMKIFITKIAV